MTDTNRLMRALREYADQMFPGCGDVQVEITIHQLRGRPARIELPLIPPGAPAPPASADDTVEADILQAVAEYDGAEPLTGEKLAQLTNYEFGTTFRRALAKLVRDGQLVNRRPGYASPE